MEGIKPNVQEKGIATWPKRTPDNSLIGPSEISI